MEAKAVIAYEDSKGKLHKDVYELEVAEKYYIRQEKIQKDKEAKNRLLRFFDEIGYQEQGPYPMNIGRLYGKPYFSSEYLVEYCDLEEVYKQIGEYLKIIGE